MSEDKDRPFSWIVNFIGPEGFRENFRVEGENADDLSDRRDATIAVLQMLGAVPDVRKLFDDNGTKAGKLSEPKPSKLLSRITERLVGEPQTEGRGVKTIAEKADEMERAAVDTFIGKDPTKVEPIKPEEYGFRQKDNLKKVADGIEFQKPASKLDKFKPKPAEQPAPVPVTASAPNVSPKLSKFVARERPSE